MEIIGKYGPMPDLNMEKMMKQEHKRRQLLPVKILMLRCIFSTKVVMRISLQIILAL